MDDNTFMKQFEDGTLPSFRHPQHIRMAWLVLHEHGWEQGYSRIQSGIKHFAEVIGHSDKYHETMTRFWAGLVQHAIEDQPDIDNFATFQKTFPLLFDKDAIKQHYSYEVLWSDTARYQWVEPDLIPMP